jgi:PAS domain S-box-containing protein
MQKGLSSSQRKIEELEYIISNIPDLVIRIDSKGLITFVNTASILFFNKSPESLLGKNLQILINEEGIFDLDYDIIQKVFDTRQAEIIESELKSSSGENKSIEIRILPEPPELSIEPHLVLMIRDVTMRKEAERKMIRARIKAEESDLLKSAFLANMSHEIRTPLNAIVGFSQIILDDDLPREEQERFYQYIQENSNQLISLVNDIIDLSKLESNQLVIRDSVFNLNHLIDEMKVMAEQEKKSREKEHIMLFPEKETSDTEAQVIGDYYRVKQVCINLLVNAIKFTPKGYIQFGYRMKDDDSILFYIRDTGIGIPRNKQEEIFQYFRQLENTLNRANTGTGLGLAICKRLAELMGGTIWVQSELSKGSSFFFTIPYRKVLPNS